MRLHCLSLIRVIDERRRFLLRVDEDHYRKTDEVLLTPLGGRPRTDTVGAQQLAALGINLADGDPLSFTAPASAYEPVRQWFNGRYAGRELDAMGLFEHQLRTSPFYGGPLSELANAHAINSRFCPLSLAYLPPSWRELHG